MSKHTMAELKLKQALPLEAKVAMSKQRIREWVQEFGTEGVYVSFSGGKDSTVLLHLVRELYPSVPAVFCDTGLEYPEIRDFVRTFDNVEWLKPRMTFKQVLDTYGYPFISKDVSAALYTAKHFLTHKEDYVGRPPLPIQNAGDEYKPYALLRLEGKIEKGKGNPRYNCSNYRFMLDAPWNFSHKCCDIMKKAPFHEYQKKTGRVPITGQMAYESRYRQNNWLARGCNAFDRYEPMSNPLSIWLEQDILQYIKQNGIEIASVYGDIAYVDTSGAEYFDTIVPEGAKLKTTKLDRTGCMFCGYGCHLEKGDGRFCLMKESHPKQYEYIMRPRSEGGWAIRKSLIGSMKMGTWILSISEREINSNGED